VIKKNSLAAAGTNLFKPSTMSGTMSETGPAQPAPAAPEQAAPSEAAGRRNFARMLRAFGLSRPGPRVQAG